MAVAARHASTRSRPASALQPHVSPLRRLGYCIERTARTSTSCGDKGEGAKVRGCEGARCEVVWCEGVRGAKVCGARVHGAGPRLWHGCVLRAECRAQLRRHRRLLALCREGYLLR